MKRKARSRNPDDVILALRRLVEAGDWSVIPHLIAELHRVGQTMPGTAWPIFWRGPLTGTGKGIIPDGKTVEALAVFEPRGKTWDDPRAAVLVPVTGARGPGFATISFASWVRDFPAWLDNLTSASRLVPKAKRARKRP